MINNFSEKAKVITVEPVLPKGNHNDDYSSYAPVIKTIKYINNLPNSITIVERSGFRFTAQASPNTYNSDFIVRTEYKLSPHCFKDIDRFFSALESTGVSGQDLRKIYESYILQRKNRANYASMVITLDSKIPRDIIEKNNGSVYLNNSDIVISSHNLFNAPTHPYYEDGINADSLRSIIKENSTGLSIELIDNDDLISTRYGFMMNQVIRFDPKTSTHKENGAYVIIASCDKDGHFYTKTQKIELHEIQQKLGLYKTQEEAIEAGDINNARKLENTKLEFEFRELQLERDREKLNAQAELSQQKFLYDRLRQEKDLEYQELLRKHEIEMLELKRKTSQDDYEREFRKNRMKDEYEEKSQTRKDNSEIVKFLPSLIIAMGAIVMAFIKITEKPKN